MRLCNPVVRLAIPGNDYGIYIQLYRIGPNNNVCTLKRISKCDGILPIFHGYQKVALTPLTAAMERTLHVTRTECTALL